MEQIVCDRCKRIVDVAQEQHVREVALVDSDTEDMDILGDLCQDCIVDLTEWMGIQIARA